MAEPIPKTSMTKLLDRICERSGIPRLLLTRALATSLISAYSIKKIILPAVNRYRKGKTKEISKARKETQESSRSSNIEEKDDDSFLAATHLVPKNEDGGSNSTAAVDLAFFRRLYRLIKIMLPGFWTVEAGLLLAHSLTLISRTVISIHVALLEGTFLDIILCT